MSYQVLARKYRPQTFAEVIGQRHVTQTLQNALEQKRIHHAYLFTGARGIGKTTVARILAKALNCEQGIGGQGPALPGREANPKDLRSKIEPCNQCGCCLEILEGRSLDVQEIDGASNTGVEDVRQVREQTKYLPAKGRYKIYIIDEVHMLSTAAFNALLKTLEEPPPHVVFIFATTEAHKIPATILSRCQRYDFKRILVQELVASLTEVARLEGVTTEPEALHLIAQEAQGSLRDAQSLFDQAVAFAGTSIRYADLKTMLGFLDRTQLFQLLEAIVKGDRHSALAQLDVFYQSGSDLNRLAQDLFVYLKHLLLLRALGAVPDWLEVPHEELTVLQSLSVQRSAVEFDQLVQLAYRGVEEVARSSVPKMWLEVLLIRMSLVETMTPLPQVLEKLERLAANPLPPPAQQKSPTQPPAGSAQPEPAAAKLTPADWEKFVAWLSREKPQWSAMLRDGQWLRAQAGSITLGFSANSIYAEMLKEEDRQKQIQKYLTQFFGRSLTLLTEALAAEGQEVATAAAPVEQAKEKKRAAVSHESVREAMNILGAVVEEVKEIS